MSSKPLTATNGLEPCPKCGNRHKFRAVSQRAAEDCCEVWLRCGSCGHEPGWMDRREDVWGSLDQETLQAIAQDWNDWCRQQRPS